MADKKTTKAEEVKTLEQLRTELAAKREDLLAARRGHAAGELANPRVLTSTKKEIARLLTAIRAAEISEKESK
ncbi:MAG TPA: 50S ribosomal protein L29 [Candidatus Saccharimonadales bacterium]|nr:50S ribosomal protein L29 [Candidatus Saccharimonadales bacterium]